MRYFVLACLVFLLTACASSDNMRYYHLHPKALQVALKNCPQLHPKKTTCAELAHVAREVNFLAYKLQRDPQGFGNSILMAQAKLAQLEADLIRNNTRSDLSMQIVQSKQKIAEYLAVVQWLESPDK